MSAMVKYITDDIKLSSQDKLFKSDIRFKEHLLVWFISGETKIVQADDTYFFKGGDIFLIPRNQLATSINNPKDGKPHKTVAMHLSTERLKQFYANLNVKPQPLATSKIRVYNNHPLLESCFASVIPYFELQDLPEDIATLKITEAITILRKIDKNVDDVLANFEEPGKLDLATYMEKNFMFNLPLEKFSYLTGRSLATFKRDFSKIYSMSPQRWLTKKRLELAHFQISEKGKKPIEVYYEVGFEDLSHFSYAFKKQFGYAPTELI